MKAILNKRKGQRPKQTRHGFLLCSLALLLMVAGVGCRQTVEGPADSNAAGTYTLVSVDGNKVPCTLTHEGHAMTVQSGVFIIHGDETCSSKVTFAVESGEELSREVKATYTKEGSTLTMKWEGAGMTTGNVAQGTFTMNNEGMIFSYRK